MVFFIVESVVRLLFFSSSSRSAFAFEFYTLRKFLVRWTSIYDGCWLLMNVSVVQIVMKTKPNLSNTGEEKKTYERSETFQTLRWNENYSLNNRLNSFGANNKKRMKIKCCFLMRFWSQKIQVSSSRLKHWLWSAQSETEKEEEEKNEENKNRIRIFIHIRIREWEIIYA